MPSEPPASFDAVREGIGLFGTLARKKSSSVIHATKGVAVLDHGRITLANEVLTRIVIVRRISRKKKNGKWHRNTYYYAIASNLPISAVRLCNSCHKRQCTESGFGELKNHYNRLYRK